MPTPSSVTDEMVEAARSVSMHRVLLDCGIDLRFDEGVAQQFRCPLHGDGVDEKGGGSARLYPDSNRAKCWGCGKLYDSIEWVSKFHRLNFIEAVEFLCREYTDVEIDEGRVSKKKIEGRSIIELFEGDFKRLFPAMTSRERVALSQTLDRLWAAGCSIESQRKVEAVFGRIRGRDRNESRTSAEHPQKVDGREGVSSSYNG